jgi:PAS domain S-box-containing protein
MGKNTIVSTQAENRLLVGILESWSERSQLNEYLEQVVEHVRNYSGCQSVGIRLLDDEGGIPYVAYTGFSRSFCDKESLLCPRSNKCECNYVISGNTPLGLHCYLGGGSFFSNSTSKLLASVPEKTKKQTCNLCNACGYESVALVPIKHQGRILGLIHVADKTENKITVEKVKFLEQVGIYIGRALHTFTTEESLQWQAHEVGERVKELNCLYGIYKLAAKHGGSLDEILKGTIDLIPPAWQYPEVTCARIRLGSQEFTTKDFKETVWRQASDILVSGNPMGSIEVYYSEERPKSDEGPFLNEERNLINAIAQRLGDISERYQADLALQYALEESHQRREEISSLLEGSRAVLQHRQFGSAARSIFDSCKNIVGAHAGYVAMLSDDGTENEVIFLDSGGLPCVVDQSLPMPIRGLRAEAYRSGKAVYNNDFSISKWIKYLPEGHVCLESVLFAPLVIESRVVGLLGLANKPGGFTENDAQLASAFGELAAVALFNSRIFDTLANSEERFRSVAETASDAILVVDNRGDIVFWNYGAEKMFGYSSEEVIGLPATVVMPERYHKSHRQGLRRVVSTGKSAIIGKTIEVNGLRKDGREFPLELSLANWETPEGPFFTAIIRDITEHKRLDQLKDDFISLVSHEIRTPLTVIMGSLNTILSEEKRLSPVEINRLLQDASLEATYLSHLLGNLLELSRAQANQLSLFTEPVNMYRIVQETVDKLQMQDSSNKVVIDLTKKLPLVNADPLRVERILYNLLENAIKYSPQGTDIRVFAKPEEDYVVIGVVDQGAGISLPDQAKLFGAFQRLEQSRPEGVSGAGLGLMVCRRLVEAHGGKIWVESEPGCGSTFLFTLPLE